MLLKLAAEISIDAQVQVVPFNEAVTADEMFICSTMREVIWVSRSDGQTVGNGK